MATESLTRLVDRLVDGELENAEVRELLTQLDCEPGGWRTCALAFIEAQTLRRDLRDLLAPRELSGGKPAPPPLETTSADPATTRGAAPAFLRRGLVALALATSLAVAFVAGRGLRREPDVSASTNAQVAQSSNDQVMPSAERSLDRATDTLPQPMTHVRLLVPNNEAAPQELTVPVYAWSAGRGRVEESGPAVMPPEVRAALERLGGEIEEEEMWAPVALENGQPAVVPIKQLRITPVTARYRAY